MYVQKLEEVILRTLEEWEIVGCRNESLRGVWVKRGESHLEKIALIGVRISKGITMNGFALNVNVDLQPFALLTPCGIENCKVTSMEKILNQKTDMKLVREQVATNFADIFNLEWTEKKWE